ncbi:MAG: SMP-30/gluconolactonase/LRE family protein [Thermodesulfobacteriota bacterium]|nr:SMP-30/gluconolactonase/LRE family protein [Thermodesulfobacteriota bacterium]
MINRRNKLRFPGLYLIFYLSFIFLFPQSVYAVGRAILITEWGGPGANDGELNSPNGIAADSAGFIYVADGYNNRIQKFDSHGNFIKKWGSRGYAEGQFSFPGGIAVGRDGFVYVADWGNRRVQKFNYNGKFIDAWEVPKPGGIAVDAGGFIYITNPFKHSVRKYNPAGKLIWEIKGSIQEGRFNYPEGIAVDSSGFLYITERNSSHIQKFDSGGNFIGKWGKSAEDAGTEGVYRIAVSPSGLINIIKQEKDGVKIFDSRHKLTATWVKSENRDYASVPPMGAVLDSPGFLYLVDKKKQSILKLKTPLTRTPFKEKTYTKQIPGVSPLSVKYPYSIKVSSNLSIEKAKETVQNLNESGLTAYYFQAEVTGKGIFYRVFLGYFPDENSAGSFNSLLPEEYRGRIFYTPYTLELGMYESKAIMEEEKNKLINSGFYPYIITGFSGSKKSYRLILGAFKTEEEAKILQWQLNEKEIESRLVLR